MLGIEIKKALKAKGLMLKHVAKVCAIPYSTLKKYASGHSPMPECKAILICEKFGLDEKKFIDIGTEKFQTG